MWTFFDFGLLMPAMVDEDLMLRPDWDEYSDHGRFDFQVRVRIIEHATYFQENFMQEGTYGPLLHTPDHDYNYRFYTTREAYADGMREAIMAIDYRKFKPSSERYPHGDRYHKVLNSIWVTGCELNEPGGVYGPWSPENPKGYRPAWQYHGWGTGENEGRRVGDTFENIDFGDEDGEGSWYMDPRFEDAENDDKLAELLDEMDRYGVSMEDWHLNMLPSEFDRVAPILRQYYGKKQVKRWRRENKRNFVL